MAADDLPDVTVVADAGRVSAASQKQIEDAGLSFILGARIPTLPTSWPNGAAGTPGQQIPDGTSSSDPGPAGAAGKWRDQGGAEACPPYPSPGCAILP